MVGLLIKQKWDGEDLVKTIKEQKYKKEARAKFSLSIKDYTTANSLSRTGYAIIGIVWQTRKFFPENGNKWIQQQNYQYFKWHDYVSISKTRLYIGATK